MTAVTLEGLRAREAGEVYQPELFERPRGRENLVLRDYQVKDHDESFRLWDSGVRGSLTRAGTGTGKTVSAIAKMDTWLRRSENHRAMVISYEQELVYQFAEEIEDFLGIKPGIEMAALKVSHKYIPSIVVASRQSLLVWKPPTAEQVEQLRSYGIPDCGSAPRRMVTSWLDVLSRGVATPDEVMAEIARVNAQPEANNGRWGRLYKFDWRYDWLLIFDEAHKHAAHLASVGPIIEWFDQNPNTRRCGMTGTPKRSDGVSIGSVMFPGISLDYPLNKPGVPCAVGDGWAVPYVQRYIRVEDVDFTSIRKIAGDFAEDELERVLGQEKQLAALVNPLLDMVGDRRTLVFSPGVQMAKDVARYINARVRANCPCGAVKWYPKPLIGDGAVCEQCGRPVEQGDITRDGEQAREIDGTTPHVERKKVYADHQAGVFQFLSVCGLCKEGYNDPEISCVAIFRPVSAAASSLAEQMKGRGCRPLRGLVTPYMAREERLEAIRSSAKPDCLIVDLVGVTGLADCASTIEIYAEGLPDKIVERAKEIAVKSGLDGEVDVQKAIEQAKAEDEQERERIRKEREEAERKARELAQKRAKANAKVKYSTHETGYGNNNIDRNTGNEASAKQLRLIYMYGMEINDNVFLSKRQAGRMIDMLLSGMPPKLVAIKNNIAKDEWKPSGPTSPQKWLLRKIGAPTEIAPYLASMFIEASKSPSGFLGFITAKIANCRNQKQLQAVIKDIRNVAEVVTVSPQVWEAVNGMAHRVPEDALDDPEKFF